MRQLPRIMELRFIDRPLLLFLSLSCFWHAGPYFWSKMVRSGSCLNFCMSLHGPHTSFWIFFIHYCELRESCPWVWHMSIHIDVPIIVNTTFLQHVLVCLCSSGHVNVFQWNWECFFRLHVELKWRFDVMTINEIPFHRLKIVSNFPVIRWCV